MSTFETVYQQLETLGETVIDGQERFQMKVMLRMVSALCDNFKQKGVINKILKLCMGSVHLSIKSVDKKKEKKKLIKIVKLTVEDYYLMDNSKVSKIAVPILEMYS